MIRYWFEFDLSNYENPPLEIVRGCGVTAWSLEDALNIIKEKIFIDREIAPIKKCIENVDITTLQTNSKLSNMGVPVWPGIWFPLGYQ